MLRPRPTLVVALLPAFVMSCSSGSVPSASGNTPAIVRSISPSCAATSSTVTWPVAVPRDFPKPPGATLGEVKQLPPKAAGAKHGVVVSVTVPAALRDEVRYVNRTLPAAGFTLGRGDAEQDEADLPFSRKDVTGQLRLRRVAACRTTWILTVLPR